jgi:hypothetical protein
MISSIKAKKPKDKACKKCDKVFSPRVPLQSVCSPTCAIELAKEKAEKKEAKDWKERKIEGLEKLKTLGEYEHDARVYFQQWIRLRDKDLPCISCGRIADRYDGGHWLKAELYSGLIFHEDNCNKQCSRPCNKDLHGNEANYRIGLVKKIGEARVKWLEENKDRLRTYSYEKEELIEIKKKYIKKIKELKQINP